MTRSLVLVTLVAHSLLGCASGAEPASDSSAIDAATPADARTAAMDVTTSAMDVTTSAMDVTLAMDVTAATDVTTAATDSAVAMDSAVSARDSSAPPTPGLDAATPPRTDAGGVSDVGCPGYATRYWDCCKAHCGWTANAAPVAATRSCSRDNAVLPGFDTASSCNGGDAHTCFSMAPWAVSDTLSYGYAAVPASSGICGRCYRLDFAGTGHYDASDPGSRALAGRSMIVQATNIGHDVGGGQFDVLIPGGGVGAFNACSRQWGVSDAALGAQYGGFLTACRAAGGAHDVVRACVRARCESVFADARFSDLRAGCLWFVNWYQAADNPNLRYREVACPDAIVTRSGVDRRPIGDIAAPSCGAGASCTCDCSWTAGGTNCGRDDGSCCWNICCRRG